MRSLLLTVLLIPALVFSSARAQPSAENLGQEVTVTVDPRIELMSAVQLLDDYFLVSDYNSLYKHDARAYFTRHKNHAAVEIFGEMKGEGFAFDAVPKAMLALAAPPGLEKRRALAEGSKRDAGGADSLARFAEALRDFTQDTGFQAFYEAHQGTYSAILDSNRQEIERAIGVLADYSGLRPAGSTVILGPLLHHGGFAARFGETGSMEAYALIGPVGVKDGLPTFGDAERIGELIWHEFSHTFVNRLTKERQAEVEQYASLHDPIAEQMREEAYAGWETVVNEHIIRAITTRLAYRRFGEEAGEKAMQEMRERGYRYIEPLTEELKSYEKNREQYPTLADFYPHLLDVFKDLHQSQ